MKYLLLICSDNGAGPSAAARSVGAAKTLEVEDWVTEYDRAGVRLLGDRTRPAADATTVQVRGGDVLVTDGPYVETKDLMAGFDVIEAADLDQAIEVASRHPVAALGAVEIRPFWEE